jgi:hypothetical protein
MPFGNRTGPWGLGPMTGRGRGYCAGFPAPGFMNPAYGFGRGFGLGGGFGRGLGLGRGRGWRWSGFSPFLGYSSPLAMAYGFPFPYGHPYGEGYPPYPYSPWTPQASGQQEQRNFPSPGFLTEEEEEDFLGGQARALEEHLVEIKKRLEELRKKKKEKK